jgi:hypothetical protein
MHSIFIEINYKQLSKAAADAYKIDIDIIAQEPNLQKIFKTQYLF